ncbi:hypothetical protein CQ059_22815 [Brucella pseudogrignonensis]|nr:hypothetical protein A8A54_21955 [Brucella pseudogrignonensis]PQZ39426.1 hypothetical protein CQ059_22815 [Brucella pseudogrignonensis]PRA41072.1 hypothetical protein CQ063_11225 [Brucella pseudogrignonensis]PRA69898.1 hypothetical protein CQ055_11110 [Brucella pseudogrignonensis]
MGQLYSLRNVLRRIIAQLDADAKQALISSISDDIVILQQQVEGLDDDKSRAFVTGALEENRRVALLMK